MTRRKHKFKLDQAGQSTIEFALTMIFIMGFSLFFLQLTLIFAFGNYVHYATFMAARAYQAASDSKADQVERAESYLKKMVKRGESSTDRLPFIAKGEGDGDITGAKVGGHEEQFSETIRAKSWMQGVRYTFKSRLFILPFMGEGGNSKVNTVTLTSESWLGREPAESECDASMSKKGWIYDNGC